MPSSSSKDLSTSIIETFSEIMSEVSKHPAPKGEGNERVLRTYLKDLLFVQKLGWAPDKLLVGELFDLYAYDVVKSLVLYIETKTPNSVNIPKDELEHFETKLVKLGTCEYGAITNGHRFLFYRCYVKQGTVITERQAEFDIDGLIKEASKSGLPESSAKAVRMNFECLVARRYLGELEKPFADGYGRVVPSSQDSESIKLFSRNLRDAVDRLTEVFDGLIDALYHARIHIGGSPKGAFTIDEPISDWSTYSGKVPLSLLLKTLKDEVDTLLELRRQDRLDESRVRGSANELKKKLGIEMTPDLLNGLLTTALLEPSLFEPKLRETTYGLIKEEQIEVFSRQTAHVILSRTILHRVSEDKGLIARRLSGQNLDDYIKEAQGGKLLAGEPARAFTDLIDRADELSGRVFYSHLYSHGLFDWWRIPDDIQKTLGDSERTIVSRYQRAVNLAFASTLRFLNIFNLKDIDRDIWKDIYQEYLPPKERSRLGGFYTPDEIVALILDLVGYKVSTVNLCKNAILDPACGSGTFVLESAKRLRRHLESNMECHSSITSTTDVRQRSWLILRRVIDKVHGIDIHPFACFLTEMNFLFFAVDLLLNAKQLDPQRSITELNFGCDDTLRPVEYGMQLTLTAFATSNSRAELVAQDKAKANQIKKAKFHFVVGNPPWSGVLRGNLSPLFDEAAKSLYKEEYKSSTDKYDIYVLFLERGIKWLDSGGKIGFITQNRYLRRKYGRGIRGFIKQNCDANYIMDLGHVGKVIFPGRTNYPAISVFTREV